MITTFTLGPTPRKLGPAEELACIDMIERWADAFPYNPEYPIQAVEIPCFPFNLDEGEGRFDPRDFGSDEELLLSPELKFHKLEKLLDYKTISGLLADSIEEPAVPVEHVNVLVNGEYKSMYANKMGHLIGCEHNHIGTALYRNNWWKNQGEVASHTIVGKVILLNVWERDPQHMDLGV